MTKLGSRIASATACAALVAALSTFPGVAAQAAGNTHRPQATSGRHAITVTDPNAPAATASHTCPYGDLCVHFHDLRYDYYYWQDYYYCGTYAGTSATEVTSWYVNNQTDGTYADFHYLDGNTGIEYDWEPPAPSSGRTPDYYDHLQVLEWIKPC